MRFLSCDQTSAESPRRLKPAWVSLSLGWGRRHSPLSNCLEKTLSHSRGSALCSDSRDGPKEQRCVLPHWTQMAGIPTENGHGSSALGSLPGPGDHKSPQELARPCHALQTPIPERGQPSAFGYKYSQARERCWGHRMPWIICPARVRATCTAASLVGHPPLPSMLPTQGTNVGKTPTALCTLSGTRWPRRRNVFELAGRCKSYFQLFPCRTGVGTSCFHTQRLFRTQTQLPAMCLWNNPVLMPQQQKRRIPQFRLCFLSSKDRESLCREGTRAQNLRPAQQHQKPRVPATGHGRLWARRHLRQCGAGSWCPRGTTHTATQPA